MNKVSWGVLVLLCLVMVPLVSAAPFDNFGASVSDVVQKLVSTVRPFFEAILGDSPSIANFSAEDVLLIRSLLFILLLIVITAVLKRIHIFSTQRGLAFIVSLVISVIAIRFMTANELILGVLLPYGALGVAITTLIPFFLIFFGVHLAGFGGLGRRITWGFYLIVFVVLWISRYSDMSTASNTIYWITFGCIVLAFVFDRTVHRYFRLGELSGFYRRANTRSVAALQAEYISIAGVFTREADKRREEIKRQLSKLGADLP